MSRPANCLIPQWPAPASVRAAFTLRSGGVSVAPFDTLNVGAHVGDAPAQVSENRRRVREWLDLPAEPVWLEQVHGAQVLEVDDVAGAKPARADAAIARRPGIVLVIQVADCLPVLLATREGGAVAAAHAGWRGLSGGVLEATVAKLGEPASRLIAWLGPAIGPAHFEVGEDVRSAFVGPEPQAAQAFVVNARGRWQCDLAQLARQRLRSIGVGEVYGGEWSTFADPQRFFSYRRDGRCGRMAALIWLS